MDSSLMRAIQMGTTPGGSLAQVAFQALGLHQMTPFERWLVFNAPDQADWIHNRMQERGAGPSPFANLFPESAQQNFLGMPGFAEGGRVEVRGGIRQMPRNFQIDLGDALIQRIERELAKAVA